MFIFARIVSYEDNSSSLKI